MPMWRKLGIAAACLMIAFGVGILVTHYVQTRCPGQASSGSVSLSQAQQIEQQLQQALALNNQGDTKGALELYDQVLSEDPSNPAALAYAGYLQWNVGTSVRTWRRSTRVGPIDGRDGRAQRRRAITRRTSSTGSCWRTRTTTTRRP